MKSFGSSSHGQFGANARPLLSHVAMPSIVRLLLLAVCCAGFPWASFAQAQQPPQMLAFDHAGKPESSERLEPVDHDDNSVDAVIDHIMEHAGLTRNFVQQAARIPNALATMDERGHRVIYYNPAFIREISSYGSPKWSQISVILHEIGHHLLGHIFEYDQNFKARELEADEFSGFLIYRMGATLQEAQLVASEYAQNWETPTHPARDQRLAAIARGWTKAQRITLHERQMGEARVKREMDE